MDTSPNSEPSRRDVLKDTAKFAGAAAAAGLLTGGVFAGQDSTVQIALVGCGGRGTGAVADALNTKSGPIKLVAMADVFPEKLKDSFNRLTKRFAAQIEVAEDRKFVGFDGYKKAIDSLRKGDVVIFATPPAFRWVQFKYAIEKGVNVFMEKPTTVDGPSTVKMLKLAEESVKKNLKVGVGLMCRHCEARGELFKKIKNGDIGDLLLLRAYRMAGRTAMEVSPKKPADISELMYQVKRFHSFLWASGGCFSDFLIHNIDEACWMKDGFPVKASGSGGRTYRADPKTGEEWIDQNFDSYTVEYTFADGAKLLLEGRTIPGCDQEFATFVHGTKGSAVVSTSGHMPSHARTYTNQTLTGQPSWVWGDPGKEPSPYQLEWDHLIEAIRKDEKYNEAERGAKSSLVTAMGRKSCHIGKIVTYDQMLKDDHDLAPGIEDFTTESPAPVSADKDGRYPVPMPGYKKREY